MSEASGRKAQGSEELSYGETLGTSPEAVEGRQKAGSFVAGTAAAATAGVTGAMIRAHQKEKRKNKLDRDMRSDERKFRRAEMASRRRARALDKQMDSDKRTARRLEKSIRGGGGGLYVTPDAATGRDVTKRFKRN